MNNIFRKKLLIPLAACVALSAAAMTGMAENSDVEAKKDIDFSTAAVRYTAPRGALVSGGRTVYAPVRHELHPGFEIGDENGVWSSDTEIDIFCVFYDENGDMTVRSDGTDKVIAPGTSNSYGVYLKNTGDTPVDYTITAEVINSPSGQEIPVKVRLKSNDGTYLLGSDVEMVPIAELDQKTAAGKLAVKGGAEYTLEWEWPFETEAEDGTVTAGDILDTCLGNWAAGLVQDADGNWIPGTPEDVSLTVRFHTVATAADSYYTDSTGAPGTGDGSGAEAVIAVLALTLSACGLTALPVIYRKKTTD